MERNLSRASDTVQGLYDFGAGGFSSPTDVVLMKWSSLDASFQFVSWVRYKTGVPLKFATSRRLQAWLQRRFQRGGVWAGEYVFPELVFGGKACGEASCNKGHLDREAEYEARRAAVERLQKQFDRFLTVTCEITGRGLSYKAFLASTGLPHSVAAQMSRKAGSNDYLEDPVTSEQLRNAAEFLEVHYSEIDNGTEKPSSTSEEVHNCECAGDVSAPKVVRSARGGNGVGENTGNSDWLTLESALRKIQADTSRTDSRRSVQNAAAGCRFILEALPTKLLHTRVNRVDPDAFSGHLLGSLEHSQYTRVTRRHYLILARVVSRTLITRYGLDQKCSAKLQTPVKWRSSTPMD